MSRIAPEGWEAVRREDGRDDDERVAELRKHVAVMERRFLQQCADCANSEPLREGLVYPPEHPLLRQDRFCPLAPEEEEAIRALFVRSQP
jgi:hypothetical protein